MIQPVLCHCHIDVVQHIQAKTTMYDRILWERREVKLTARGHNPATTTIQMWNQCSNRLTTDDEGRMVSIKNAWPSLAKVQYKSRLSS